MTREQIDEQFGLNFNGLFFTIQKAAPYLSNGASIVVTTSFLNAVGTPGLSILSATKAAVRSLVRSLGAELAPRGIRINAVSPGPIDTPFATKLGIPDADLQKTGRRSPQQCRSSASARWPKSQRQRFSSRATTRRLSRERKWSSTVVCRKSRLSVETPAQPYCDFAGDDCQCLI